jgi:hypothetical protein
VVKVTTSPGVSLVTAERSWAPTPRWHHRSAAGAPEGVGRFGCPTRQAFTEGRLLAQGLTRLDLTDLTPLDLADLPGCGQDLASLAGCNEHDAVVVAAEYDVVAGDQACPEPCADQRVWFLLIDTDRAGRAAAVAEDRQRDLSPLRTDNGAGAVIAAALSGAGYHRLPWTSIG